MERKRSDEMYDKRIKEYDILGVSEYGGVGKFRNASYKSCYETKLANLHKKTLAGSKISHMKGPASARSCLLSEIKAAATSGDKDAKGIIEHHDIMVDMQSKVRKRERLQKKNAAAAATPGGRRRNRKKSRKKRKKSRKKRRKSRRKNRKSKNKRRRR